jgi:hypothetical protein
VPSVTARRPGITLLPRGRGREREAAKGGARAPRCRSYDRHRCIYAAEHELEHPKLEENAFDPVPQFVIQCVGEIGRRCLPEVVLVIMGNAGLAERGDARIWFGADADADPDLYQRLWTLPGRKGLEGALERRDRSVSAYIRLLRLWHSERDAYRSSLAAFIDLHARAMAPMRELFQSVVAQGPAIWLQSALARIDGLPSPSETPQAARVSAEEIPKFGMCGLLRPIDVPVTV